jgi:CheY-like chemotaxis protein/anti-sigma regulatory factor (Ser/Thr protein kinase)
MARLLVVDDTIVGQRLAGGLLEKQLDWSVTYARNGAEALERVEDDLPDLVVTDLQMPEMNGLELVEALRKQHPLIPVVLMTAAGSETIAVEALECGAASYVPKKELAADLVDTVSRVLAALPTQRGQRRLLHSLTAIDYELQNDPQLLSALVGEVRGLLSDRRMFDETECLRCATTLDEALSNAYYHGNLEISSALREQDANAYHELAAQRRTQDPYRDRRIYVKLGLTKEKVTITVRDEGAGFDPSTLPDPTSEGFLERPCGRGLLLMRSFSDEIEFNDTGNEVMLVKHAAPPSGEGTSIHDE